MKKFLWFLIPAGLLIAGITYGGNITVPSSPAAGSVLFGNANGNYNSSTTPLFVDTTNARLGIGTTTPAGTLHIYGTTATFIDRISSLGSNLLMRRGNGTAAAPTAVVNGDILGRINLSGYDGTAWVTNNGNGVWAYATENWSSTNHGAATVFTSTANGVTAASEKMRLDSTGYFGIANSSPSVALEVGSNTTGQNAKVSATLGSELAPALTGASGVNWTFGAGWTTPLNNTADKTADGTGTLTPTAATTIVAGTTYKVVITLSAYSVGTASYTLGGTSGGTNLLSATSTYTGYVVAGTTAKLIITPSNTSRFTISAISIKAVTTTTGTLTAEGTITSGTQILAGTGLVTAPAYSFTNSPNSGMYLKTGGVAIASLGNDQVMFETGTPGMTLIPTYQLQWASVSPYTTVDLILKRGGAAILQMGVNAAAPIAQTLTGPAARSGTDTDAAGGNITLRSGLGTGTGTPSDILFVTPDASTTSGTFAQATTTKMIVKGSGNVGIGTTTPAYGFVSIGTVQFPTLTTSAGLQTSVICGDANGQLIADSVACLASARRFKKDIKPLKVGLEEILKLEPVQFKWTKAYNKGFEKDPNKNGVQYSLIADEVRQIDPKLTTVDKQGKVYGLADLNHWVALFVQSFKDIEEQIKRIMFKQNTDEAKIEKLEQRVDVLTRQVNLLLKERD